MPSKDHSKLGRGMPSPAARAVPGAATVAPAAAASAARPKIIPLRIRLSPSAWRGPGHSAAAASEDRLADRSRQRLGRLEDAEQRQHDQEVEEVVGRRHLSDQQPEALRRLGAGKAQQHHVDQQKHEEEAEDRPEAPAAHRRTVEPGQHEEQRDGPEHGDHAAQLGLDDDHAGKGDADVEGDGAQDRIDGRKYHSGTICAGVDSGLAGM